MNPRHPPECPRASDLVEFAEGDLDDDRRCALEAHIDRCDTCLAAVAAVLQAPGPAADHSRIDRYTVTRVLGQGAMGTVYAAHDPVLNRTVALKVLRPDRGATEQRRARLLREAEALAQVRHPNVVSVFEAAEHNREVHVAMELVEGVSLDELLEADDPRWQRIVALFEAAGEGLDAVHAAGIVHRDFKPSNVRVTSTGRVVVTDFGLAGIVADGLRDSVDASDDAAIVEARLTVTGGTLGTPAYMSPEQMAQGRPTPATDQFAFCAALFEALTGELPHTARSYDELQTAKARGLSRAQRRRIPGPRGLGVAVARGLEPDPDRRYPGMTDLLRALRRARHHRRDMGLVVSSVATAVLIGFGWWWTARPPARCSDPLGDVWEPRHRAAMALQLEPHFTERVATRVLERSDAYALALEAAYEHVCPSMPRDPSAASVGDASQWGCLETRRSAFESMVERIGTVPANAKLATTWVDRLPGIEPCRDVETAVAESGLPRDSADFAEALELRRELAAILGGIDVRDADSEPRLQRALARGKAAGDPAVQAEAHHLLSVLFSNRRDLEAAVEHGERAYHLAAGIGYERLTRRASSSLVSVLGQAGRGDEARTWAKVAAPLQHTAGQRAGLEWDLGRLEHELGRFEAAREHLEAARAMLGTGGAPGLRSEIGTDLGAILNALGEHRAATEVLRTALELTRQVYGPRDIQCAGILRNLGSAAVALGEYAQARGHYEDAIEIATSAPNEGSPITPKLHAGLLVSLTQLGHWKQADAVERAIVEPIDASLRANITYVGAIRLFRQGRWREALEQCDRSVDETSAAHGAGDPVTRARQVTCLVYAAQAGDWDERSDRLVHEILAILGEEAADVRSFAQWALGRARLNDGDAAGAEPLLSAAHAHFSASGGGDQFPLVAIDLAAALAARDEQGARRMLRAALEGIHEVPPPDAVAAHLRAAEVLAAWGDRPCAARQAQAAASAATDPPTPELLARARRLAQSLPDLRDGSCDLMPRKSDALGEDVGQR